MYITPDPYFILSMIYSGNESSKLFFFLKNKMTDYGLEYNSVFDDMHRFNYFLECQNELLMMSRKSYKGELE